MRDGESADAIWAVKIIGGWVSDHIGALHQFLRLFTVLLLESEVNRNAW